MFLFFCWQLYFILFWMETNTYTLIKYLKSFLRSTLGAFSHIDHEIIFETQMLITVVMTTSAIGNVARDQPKTFSLFRSWWLLNQFFFSGSLYFIQVHIWILVRKSPSIFSASNNVYYNQVYFSFFVAVVINAVNFK